MNGSIAQMDPAAGNVPSFEVGAPELAAGRHAQFLGQMGRRGEEDEVHGTLQRAVLFQRAADLGCAISKTSSNLSLFCLAISLTR